MGHATPPKEACQVFFSALHQFFHSSFPSDMYAVYLACIRAVTSPGPLNPSPGLIRLHPHWNEVLACLTGPFIHLSVPSPLPLPTKLFLHFSPSLVTICLFSN